MSCETAGRIIVNPWILMLESLARIHLHKSRQRPSLIVHRWFYLKEANVSGVAKPAIEKKACRNPLKCFPCLKFSHSYKTYKFLLLHISRSHCKAPIPTIEKHPSASTFSTPLLTYWFVPDKDNFSSLIISLSFDRNI